MFRNLWRVIAVATAFLILWPLSGRAEVKLPAVFSDHMVVQSEAAVNVWGWADPGETVVVRIAGQRHEVTADAQGRWTTVLQPLRAGGPYTMTVAGTNTITVEDVLAGEVWLCSGQSNMAMTVSRVANAEEEIAAARFPQIRMFTVARRTATEPQQDCEGQWQVCSPETVGSFSATAYFFARTLHQRLHVPVGLLHASWGGTPVEAWTSLQAQAKVPEIAPVLRRWEEQIARYDPEAARQQYEKRLAAWKQAAARARAAGKRPPRRPTPPADPRTSQHRPGNLFNAMIAPLVPYSIRGAIWYQGERNSRDELARLYGIQLQTLIANWRDVFAQGDFPFLFVQLPNYMAPQQQPSETTGWVLVRDGMFNTLAVVNTGMAVTIDIGEENNIHPKNKQDVGKRLALWALHAVYDQDVVGSGPLYRSMSRQGGKIILRFDYVDGGLATRDGGPLEGFAIAGADRRFVWAEARIEGDTVVVSSPEVPEPVAVRYAWANNPRGNLINKAGLPASPFRTDRW